MFEDILRECLMFFLKVIDVVELPPEEILRKYGTTKIYLTLTFGPEAGERLRLWCNQKGVFIHPALAKSERSSDVQRELDNARKQLTREKRRKCESPLLLGFLFGWWWGRKD